MLRVSEESLAGLSRQDRAALQRLARENPLALWRPFPKQALFLAERDAMVKMFAGGNGAGKSEVGVVNDLIQCVDPDCLPAELRRFQRRPPPHRCRVVSPDFTATSALVILEKLRKLAPRAQLAGGTWERAYDKSLRLLRFENGSYIQFLTAEQDVDKHSGAALDSVHFDEEPPGDKGRQIFIENMGRLREGGGQCAFTMTPLLGLSWTYDEIYQRRAEPGTFVVTATMDDNPTLDADWRRQFLSKLTDEERKARERGEFVHFKGLVFDELEGRHLTDPPSREHLADQEVVVGIDPGIRRTACVWVAFDSDNQALAFDELYLPDATPDAVADLIRDRNGRWGVRPIFHVIDPSARNRTLTSAEAVESEYIRAGIATVHGQNDVEAGILTMKRRLRTDPPSLLVSRDCHHLLAELDRYRMDDRADGRFAVVKADDHAIDALRYALMSRPYGFEGPPPRKRNRWGAVATYTPTIDSYDRPVEPVPMEW